MAQNRSGMPRALHYIFLGLIGLVSGPVSAQQPPSPEGAPPAAAPPVATQPSKAAVSMEERLPGDHWIIEIRDEISGTINTATNVVTEVTPKDISLRVDVVRPDHTSSEGLVILDRSWNIIRNNRWQYFPYDGNVGVQTPLTVGKTWAFQFTAVNNTARAAAWKWSGASMVVGQETVTTKAGTFDTFKIETRSSSTNIHDPTHTEELVSQTWYAPVIAHWVKSSRIFRTDNHLQSNSTSELVEFARKQ